MLFKVLLFIHFLIDFNLQNDDKAEKKENQIAIKKTFYQTEIFKHTLLYTLLSSVIFLQYQSLIFWNYMIVLVAFLLHGVINLIKIFLTKKYIKCQKSFFITDQLLHIILLYFLTIFIQDKFITNFQLPFDVIYIDYFLALLLLGKTANVIFGIFFGKFKPNKEGGDDDGHKNAGGLIGTME